MRGNLKLFSLFLILLTPTLSSLRGRSFLNLTAMGLQFRPARFDVTVIFEVYGKPGGRGIGHCPVRLSDSHAW